MSLPYESPATELDNIHLQPGDAARWYSAYSTPASDLEAVQDQRSSGDITEQPVPIVSHERASSNGHPPGGLHSSGLDRKLRSIHIFFLSVSTCIGLGFYVRTGNMDGFGGPGAAIYAYALLGILSSMVLHNIATMLRVWPVAGALLLYVKHFLDEEIGIVITIVYWLTYCFSAAALAATVADTLAIFHLSDGPTAAIMIIVIAIPIVLNSLKLNVFRNIEIGLGAFKIVVALVIILAMNITNSGQSSNNNERLLFSGLSMTENHLQERDNLFLGGRPHQAAGWFGGFMSSIFLGSFSLVGIEVVAVAAQETVVYQRRTSELTSQTRWTVTDQFSWPARWVPAVITVLYIWGTWSVTASIPSSNLLQFYPSGNLTGSALVPCQASIFIDAACQNGGGNGLAKALTILLMISLTFTATAAVYASSRTLYGFANDMIQNGQVRHRRILGTIFGFCARTNKYNVPQNAVFVSAWLFWVPFLKFTNAKTFEQVSTLLTDMGSVCCILLWACESFAAMRLYYSYKHHKTHVERVDSVGSERMQRYLRVEDNGWYIRNMLISGSAGVFCLLVVVLGGSMYVLETKTSLQGAASFGVLGLFMILYFVLKLNRGIRKDGVLDVWRWNSLDKDTDFQDRVDSLNRALSLAGVPDRLSSNGRGVIS